MEATQRPEMPNVRNETPTLYRVASFEAFYREQFRPILRTALALTRDVGAAEDLTQDAFLVARNRWDEISQYERPDMFVRRVVVNRSRSRFRSFTREVRALGRLRGRVHDTGRIPDPAPEVWEAIASLSRRQAQVVVLAIIEDLSVAEVAEILECGNETVKTHLRRAKSRLAELLEDTR